MNRPKITRVFVPAILFLCLFAAGGVAANAQGGSGKVTPTPSPTKTKAKPNPKTTKTVRTKSKKTPDPPVGDWEMTNLYGHWEGTYNEIKSDLEIERVDGDNFYGYFTTKDGFKIAFTGTVERKTRKVTITETEVLAKPANSGWALGVNAGTLEYGGFGMKGTRKDGSTVYTWSYIQII